MEARHLFMGAKELREELKKLQRIKDIWDSKEYNEAVKKASRMSATSMLDWIDVAGSGMAQGFLDYRRHGEIESLYEIRRAVSQIQALTEELIIRHENSE